MDYVLVAGKFAIGMLVMILQINILGKYEFSLNTPLNQIQNYVLGGIIGGVIYNASINLLQFVVILLIWSLVVIIVKVAGESSRRIRSVLEGNPQVIVRDGEVDVALCSQLGLSAEQLSWRLREEGIESVDGVASAVMETNGKLTIIPRGERAVSMPVIADGHIDDAALAAYGCDREWLAARLSEQGIVRESDVFLGEVEGDGLKVVPYPRGSRRIRGRKFKLGK